MALILGIFALFESSFAPILRQPVFDTYQRLAPRVVDLYPAVIVDIDDRSMAVLGQWPWPRTLIARLVEAVARLDPLAIGFDIIMPESDRLSPARQRHTLTSTQVCNKA